VVNDIQVVKELCDVFVCTELVFIINTETFVINGKYSVNFSEFRLTAKQAAPFQVNWYTFKMGMNYMYDKQSTVAQFFHLFVSCGIVIIMIPTLSNHVRVSHPTRCQCYTHSSMLHTSPTCIDVPVH